MVRLVSKGAKRARSAPLPGCKPAGGHRGGHWNVAYTNAVAVDVQKGQKDGQQPSRPSQVHASWPGGSVTMANLGGDTDGSESDRGICTCVSERV